MSRITVIDNLPRFGTLAGQATDRALNRMAVDIERMSKAQVPVKHGQLRSAGHHTKLGYLRYQIYYNMVYARFQEFGGDLKRRVRRYTKPGSKSFFLRDPGNHIAKQAVEYFRRAASEVTV